ncbi:MAG: hypothetical protein H8E32_13555 [Nitrospinae bacterium]|nr:hypothetical protein [Nitrospinota bacterium]
MDILKDKDSLTENRNFVVDHDAAYLRFSYWSQFLNLNETQENNSWGKQSAILLNGNHPQQRIVEGIVNHCISIQNKCNSPVLNFYIYSRKAGKTIFKLPELPDKKSIKLEFKKEGLYEFYFHIAGSTSFSKITLNIFPSPNKNISIAENFDWNLKSPW